MKVLLDTQTIVNYLRTNSSLPTIIQDFVEDYDNTCFVSVISLHEIVIKTAKNKMRFDYNLTETMEYLEQEGIGIIGLLPSHIQEVEKFEQYACHKDPFDRLLIAQCIAEKLTFLTTDTKVPLYQKWGLEYLQYDN